MTHTESAYKPGIAKLATKLTPAALGLGMIEGLPAEVQAFRMICAAQKLLDMANVISPEVRS